ncbi:MAG: ATP-binding protein [Clostridiales bacterium]|nr:ATP-binding protein [Clostridiales bacterium]
MDSVYEDVRRILENRRIRSEIQSRETADRILEEYPAVRSVEDEIDQLEMERMTLAIRGANTEDLENKIREAREKKAQVLKECHITPEDFMPKPFCRICGDTGYVSKTDRDGKEETTICECVRSLLAPVMLRRSGVERYPEYAFEKGKKDFYADSPVLAALYERLLVLSKKETVPNLVFYGCPGKGKTFLAASVARQYAMQGRSSLVMRLPDFQELAMEHRKALQAFYLAPQKERDIEERFAYLSEADLLVLDDLGVEPRTANSEADLLSLVDRRLLTGKVTIITTNYDTESLRERYGGRFFDRIDRSFKRICFREEKKS